MANYRTGPDGRRWYNEGRGGWVAESHGSHSKRDRMKKAKAAGVSYEAYPEWAKQEKLKARKATQDLRRKQAEEKRQARADRKAAREARVAEEMKDRWTNPNNPFYGKGKYADQSKNPYAEGQTAQANEAVDAAVGDAPVGPPRGSTIDPGGGPVDPDRGGSYDRRGRIGTGFETSQTPLRDEYVTQNPNAGQIDNLPPSSLARPDTPTSDVVGDDGMPPLWMIGASGYGGYKAAQRMRDRFRDRFTGGKKGPYRLEGDVDSKTKTSGKKSLAYRAGEKVGQAGRAIRDDFYAHSTDPNKNPRTRGQTGPAPKGGKDFTGKPIVSDTPTPPQQQQKGTNKKLTQQARRYFSPKPTTAQTGPRVGGGGRVPFLPTFGSIIGGALSGKQLYNTYGDDWTFTDPRTGVLHFDSETPGVWADALGETAQTLVGGGQGGYEALGNMGLFAPLYGGDDYGTQLDTLLNVPGAVKDVVTDMGTGIGDILIPIGSTDAPDEAYKQRLRDERAERIREKEVAEFLNEGGHYGGSGGASRWR